MKAFLVLAAVAASVSAASAQTPEFTIGQCYNKHLYAKVLGQPRPDCTKMYFPEFDLPDDYRPVPIYKAADKCWDITLKEEAAGKALPPCAGQFGIHPERVRAAALKRAASR